MPHHYSTKDSFKVKEQFHLGTHMNPKELDKRVTHAHSYEVLPSYIGVLRSKTEKVRRAKAPEKQEQGCHYQLMVWILTKVII